MHPAKAPLLCHLHAHRQFHADFHPAPVPPSCVQARTAVGWEPEGVHLTLWTRDSVLVSWQTGGGCGA